MINLEFFSTKNDDIDTAARGAGGKVVNQRVSCVAIETFQRRYHTVKVSILRVRKWFPG